MQRQVLGALAEDGAYIDTFLGVWIVPPTLYPAEEGAHWERIRTATFEALLRKVFIVDIGWTRYRITDAGREVLQMSVALQANYCG